MEVENKNINFIFFGTPDFAVGVLEELKKKGLVPSLVITAPDKPQGRGLTLTPPPVKVWAGARKIPVLQPQDWKLEIGNWKFDLFIVAAYGRLIPKNILNVPKHGTLNVHPSLLPRLRGASPIQSAILGEEKTGVTIMQMDEQMDHGPIVAQRERIIKKFRNNPPKASELERDLAHFGGELLAEVIPEWVSGKLHAVPQNHTLATFCKKIAKEDALVDLNDDSLLNVRKIRAYDEWPGAYFFAEVNGKKVRVKIIDAAIEKEIAKETGRLNILQVVPEGKKKMPYEDFLRGISQPK